MNFLYWVIISIIFIIIIIYLFINTNNLYFRAHHLRSGHWNDFRLLWWCPPLWDRRQHARLSRSGPGFDPRSGQVRFFRGFSSPVIQMSGSFRPRRRRLLINKGLINVIPSLAIWWFLLSSCRSPNVIWPSLSSSLIIYYGRQWPEMLTRPKPLNIHTYIMMANDIRGWLGPMFYWHLSYGWGRMPEKTQLGKLTRAGIEAGPATWEATNISEETRSIRYGYTKDVNFHLM